MGNGRRGGGAPLLPSPRFFPFPDHAARLPVRPDGRTAADGKGMALGAAGGSVRPRVPPGLPEDDRGGERSPRTGTFLKLFNLCGGGPRATDNNNPGPGGAGRAPRLPADRPPPAGYRAERAFSIVFTCPISKAARWSKTFLIPGSFAFEEALRNKSDASFSSRSAISRTSFLFLRFRIFPSSSLWVSCTSSSISGRPSRLRMSLYRAQHLYRRLSSSA